MRTALTIAGSDSGGGAGIQADLKSFAGVGVHGTSVVTCVTAQNTCEVASIFPLPTAEIRKQLRAVLSDFEVRAAKTGMLYSADIVRTVARELAGTRFPLVVDPVMIATVGASLERDDFRDALVDRLLPRATLVTPNLHEAERLSGLPVRTEAEAVQAARAIRSLGPSAVLVKGGHLEGRLVDVLYDGRRVTRLSGYRHDKKLHGAGCTLAASTAAYLALGRPLAEAIQAARARVAAGFSASYRAGRGVEIINSHVAPDRYEVWHAVNEAAPRLAGTVPRGLVPMRGIDLGYALPGAMSPEDVCSLGGPILPLGRRLAPTGPPRFPASRDAALPILAAMRHDPGMRAAANLKYVPKNERRLRSARLVVAALDRTRRPGGASLANGGTEEAIVEAGAIPDVITDDRTSEMRILGRDPQDVLRKARRVARVWNP